MIQSKKPIIVTGAAGFIGFHLSQKLMEYGLSVIGIDNLNNYYDPNLKNDRLGILQKNALFDFHKLDLIDEQKIKDLFLKSESEYIIHLAAQAGVRYCIDNPSAYTQSNLIGQMSILEAIRALKPKHTIYASSSSVYGNTTEIPFSVENRTDTPVSLYAATKKSGEMLAYSYAKMYDLHLTGLRFFTVYGPYGRPDMAYFKFTQKILNSEPIEIYNHGDMLRDFTYIDDIVRGIIGCISLTKANNDAPPHRLLNIGHNNPEKLMNMIAILEQEIGFEAHKKYLPMQIGDVYATYANIDELFKLTGVKPEIDLKTGLNSFVKWYKNYYKITS